MTSRRHEKSPPKPTGCRVVDLPACPPARGVKHSVGGRRPTNKLHYQMSVGPPTKIARTSASRANSVGRSVCRCSTAAGVSATHHQTLSTDYIRFRPPLAAAAAAAVQTGTSLCIRVSSLVSTIREQPPPLPFPVYGERRWSCSRRPATARPPARRETESRKGSAVRHERIAQFVLFVIKIPSRDGPLSPARARACVRACARSPREAASRYLVF